MAAEDKTALSGAAGLVPEPAVTKLSSSEDTGIDRLSETWVNLENERGERNADLHSLWLQAAGEEGVLGHRRAAKRLANYRDALIGLEHTLAEREQVILQQATDNAELTGRLAELERQVAEITGRWRESDAVNARLQAMLADAVRDAERVEGDLRQAREGAEQMARPAEVLRADLAASRAALAGRDGQMVELASRLEILKRDVAGAEDRAARVDAMNQQLQQQLAREIEVRDAAVSELREQLAVALADREAEQDAPAREMCERLDRLQAEREQLGADADQQRRTRLVVSLDGENTIKYPLYKDSMIIGRGAGADIHVVGRFTSRRHARILLLEDDTAVIEDLGSLNGIRVNERTVIRQPLHDGDMLDIGGAHLQYIDLAEREAAHSSA